MSLFGDFFKKPHAESVVLISIGAGTVSGAYAHYKEGEPPTVLYARALAIEPHEGEESEPAMERSLESLASLLITEGAPALHRATGSGTADTILVSIDAPWQTTWMRIVKIEPGNSFVFTPKLVNEHLAAANQPLPNQVLVDESLVGTILNGYETREPYGKRATSATIIILVSSIIERVATTIAGVLRRCYHTKNILLIAGVSLRYQAIRAAFPLERDCLILDATGPEIALALVRHGFLVAVHEAPTGSGAQDAWGAEVRTGLSELAKSYPLPQVIFLIAGDTDTEKLSAILTAGNLGDLWLSENPPKTIALNTQHLGSFVKVAGETKPSLTLSLMAIYGKVVLSPDKETT